MNAKSPKPIPPQDGFFSLTLGRKKKREVADLEQESRDAIDGVTSSQVDYIDPANFKLEDGEERSMVDMISMKDPKLDELKKVLKDWINNTLVEQRIIVQELEEDLFDGQVLQKLLENLGDIKLQVPEVTQTSQGQKEKLRAVLDEVHKLLELSNEWDTKWSVDSIHSKNLIAILHLLVALATHYRAPIRIPEKVALKVHIVKKKDGKLDHKIVEEHITSTLEEMTGGRFERDAFDTLFDHAPDKLSIVKRSLIEFANRHLEKVNLVVTDLDTQFSDGVFLVLLMGLLEGYFVPLHCFTLTPDSFEEKVHNLQFAFELMQDAGLPKPKARPEGNI